MSINVTTELVGGTCPTCGIVYGLPSWYYETRRRDGGSWYCPNGHSLGFTECENDRLKKQLARKQELLDYQRESTAREREARKQTERRLSATKGVVTRIKNRVGKGVCPCCNRHFDNLQRHMATKHPDWSEESLGGE